MAERVETEFILSLDAFQQQLNVATKSMEGYDKAADQAVAANKDLSGQSGSAAQKVRELAAASDATATRLGKVGGAAKDLGKELVNTAKGSLDVTQGFGRIGQAAVTLGRTAIAALGPIGIAIAAVAAALVGLGKIFFDTERGADALGRVTSTVSTIFQRLLGLAQQLAFAIVDTFKNPQQAVKDLWEAIKVNIANRLQGLVDQFKFLGEVISGVFTLDSARIEAGVKGFAESTVQAFTGVDNAVGKVTAGFNKLGQEIRGAAKDGQRIFEIGEELEDLAIRRAKEEAKLNRIVSEQLTIARDANATTAQRKAAAEEAIKAQDKLADLAKRQAVLELEKLTLEQKQNDTRAEGLLERAKLEAQVDQIEADRLDAQRRARAIISGIDKANADAAVANAKRVAEERKKAEEQAAEAAAKEAQRRTQIEQAASEQLLKIRQDRELAGLTEVERREVLLREAARKEIELTRKLFNDLESITAEADIPGVRAQQAEAILGIEEDLAERLAELRGKEVEATVEEAEQNTLILQEQLARRVALVEDAGAALGSILADAATGNEDVAKNASRALLDIAFKALEQQALIATGAAQVLSLSQADSIATFGASGVARAAIIAALIRAALGAARAGISGAFYDGGIVGRDGGTKMHSGRDGYLVRAHYGEAFINARATAKYMPYIDAMNNDTFEHLVAISKATSATPIPSFSDRGIVGAIGGSIAEERRQTELLATIAKGMRRGVNKRYYA